MVKTQLDRVLDKFDKEESARVRYIPAELKGKAICIKDMAKHYDVSTTTVRKWIKKGLFKTEQPGGEKGLVYIVLDNDSQSLT